MFKNQTKVYLHLREPASDGLVVSMSASHAVGLEFAPWSGYTKELHKMVQTASLLGTRALG